MTEAEQLADKLKIPPEDLAKTGRIEAALHDKGFINEFMDELGKLRVSVKDVYRASTFEERVQAALRALERGEK